MIKTEVGIILWMIVEKKLLFQMELKQKIYLLNSMKINR